LALGLDYVSQAADQLSLGPTVWAELSLGLNIGGLNVQAPKNLCQKDKIYTKMQKRQKKVARKEGRKIRFSGKGRGCCFQPDK
jgi:hypothetical protein